ncbi:MAG TPA: hypothetical protein VLD67_06340 [Vicinamibacterales bacterium]|nr:hypothetical protein [Vicinamibacterales bacterium]
MEMFLMVLCLSLLGVAVSALAFGAATRDVRDGDRSKARPQPRPSPSLPVVAPQFFADTPAVGATRSGVPIELLLLQLERHVRLEQAAAESFLMAPTLESLHSRTSSPLLH